MRAKLAWGITLLGLSSSTQGANVTPCDVLTGQLSELMSVHDTDYSPISLPSSSKKLKGLVVKKEDALRYYDLAVFFFRENFDIPMLQSFFREFSYAAASADEKLAELKEVRKRLKHLRFTFLAFGKSHKKPKTVHRLTKAMGEFQDAVKAGDLQAIERSKGEVLEILAERHLERNLTEDLESFRPTKKSAYLDWMDESISEIEKFLQMRTALPDQVHTVRKTISSLMTVINTTMTFRPSVPLEQLRKYVSTLNYQLGLFHDSLVASAFRGEIDYENGQIDIQNNPALSATLPALADLSAFLRQVLAALGQ